MSHWSIRRDKKMSGYYRVHKIHLKRNHSLRVILGNYFQIRIKPLTLSLKNKFLLTLTFETLDFMAVRSHKDIKNNVELFEEFGYYFLNQLTA